MQIAALLVIAGLSARTKLYPGTPKLLSSDEILESKFLSVICITKIC